jgi:citrate lyase subunit beta/citryl-CoA lyase
MPSDPRRRPEIALRSLQFVPGDRIDVVEAAMRSGADALIIDLSEPRTPFGEDDRSAARAAVAAHIGRVADDGPRQYVRVRPPQSGYMLRDLMDVCVDGLAGIVVPGVRDAADVVAADALVANVEVERGLEPGSVVLYPILETAQSLRVAHEIAMASTRVAHLGGAISRGGDLCEALGYRWTAGGAETLYLRSKVLIDARAAGIRYPIGGMWGGDADDLDGLRAFAVQTRDLGYFGMLTKESSHAPIVNEVFSPSDEEIEQWQAMDRAARDAEGSDQPAMLTMPDGTSTRVKSSYLGAARAGLEWARALGLAQ